MVAYDLNRTRLGRIAVSPSCPLPAALRLVTAAAAETLQVERVGVWRFLSDLRAIQCHFLHERGRSGIDDGAVLYEKDLPRYFAALEAGRTVSIASTFHDPLADGFREAYFLPLGIGATLDVPVFQNGGVAAVVCHEHIGTDRDWLPQDIEFAAAVSQTVARLYGEALLAEAHDRIGSYRAQVQQLTQLGAVGRLAAGMAHDFGNVLMVAQGSAELIAAHEPRDVVVSGMAEDICAATTRGRRLVDALMRLARPTTSTPVVCDLGALVRDATPVLMMAAGRDTKLTISAPHGLPRVLIDPDELERVLVNLVVNARDATPSGGSVHCRVHEVLPDEPGRTSSLVAVEVADTGHGMDEATLQRSFEPFFTTKGDAGSGLGLAIVRQVVVMAGGVVDAKSSPGQGTTIRICLPAIAGPAPAARGTMPRALV